MEYQQDKNYIWFLLASAAAEIFIYTYSSAGCHGSRVVVLDQIQTEQWIQQHYEPKKTEDICSE